MRLLIMRLLVSIAFLAVAAMPAKADRPVTDAERTSLSAAVAAQGCSGGKMEWDSDDREFEIDDALCKDGRKYDLEFDAKFKLIRKERDD
jgi:hypothetical protein